MCKRDVGQEMFRDGLKRSIDNIFSGASDGSILEGMLRLGNAPL
jgi:hypothetical protein